MRILLDTTAYAAALRGDESAARFVREADLVGMSVVVLGELQSGFFRGTRRAENEQRLESFLAGPRVYVFTIDEDTSRPYGVIAAGLRSAGTPIPTNDVWIAATAMQHGLTLVTADSHFRHVPQVIVEFIPAQ